MKKLSVKAKFQFGAGCILFLYCVTAATIAYHFLKGMVEDEINDSDRQPSHAPSQGPRHGVFILGLTFLSHWLFAVSGRPLAATLHLQHERDLILADEKRFAAQVSARVIDKPRLDVWMILIPVFFIFYFWQLKRYAKGRDTLPKIS